MCATVLLVHEEAEILGSLARLLGGLGFHVVTAASGQEAIKRVHQDEYDVVVLDLLMRGSDPVGLLRQVRSLMPLTEVIFLVNEGAVAAAATGLRLGAFDFVLTSEASTELPYKIVMGKARKTQQEEKIRLAELSLAGLDNYAD